MSIIPKKRTSAALLALALAAIPATTQAVNYNRGDLVVGFRATGGTGANDIFMYNIGSIQDVRDDFSGTLGSVGINLDSALTSVFGASWSSRSDVQWAAVGQGGWLDSYNSNTLFDQNGDPSGTVYISRAGTSATQSTTAFNNPARSTLDLSGNSVGTALEGAGTGSFQNVANETSDSQGGFNTTSEPNAWSEFFTGGVSFQAFPSTAEDSLNAGTDYLDIYRYAGSPVSNSYITTLSLDDSGNLSLVPEPSQYTAILGFLAIALVALRRRRS